MKVLITGATGFIGRALVASLLADGHAGVALTRNPIDGARALDQRAMLVRWDGRTAAGWAAHLDGADAVVNLAGENVSAGRWSASMKRHILQSRLDAAAAIVEAMHQIERRPRVLIQASGIGAYGHDDEKIFTEDDPFGAGFLADVSRQWEPATAAVEAWGVRRAIVRTAMVLGRGGALAKMLPAFKLFVGGPIGKGAQGLPWIHLADEVGAIRLLIDRDDLRGPFNLVAPETVTSAEFAFALGRALGRPAKLATPGFALKILFGEMADEMLLNGQRALPKRLQEAGYTFRFPTLAGALEDILR